jgi:hypothetical protein
MKINISKKDWSNITENLKDSDRSKDWLMAQQFTSDGTQINIYVFAKKVSNG